MNWASFASPVHSDSPFPWVLIESMLDEAERGALFDSIPESGFVRRVDDRGRYSLAVTMLISRGGPGTIDTSDLSQVWQTLLAELKGDRYRQALGPVLGVDLSHSMLTVKLARYGPGGWIGPHTDVESTIASHTIPLNPTWPHDGGGALILLGSSRIEDIRHAVPPDSSASIAFVRSDRSWHAVSMVADEVSVARASLVIHFER